MKEIHDSNFENEGLKKKKKPKKSTKRGKKYNFLRNDLFQSHEIYVK